MIDLQFTEEEKKVFHYERFHHPHPRVQRKMEALWLKTQGESHQRIAQLTGLTPNMITRYLKDYQAGGIEKLKEISFYQPTSELVKHQQTLEDYFKAHPPATIKEAMDRIEKITGLKRSEKSITKFFNKLGLKRRKVGMVPSKADPEKQEAFKKKLLEPRLEEAKAGKRTVFFVDAAHFVLAPFLGYLWSTVRLFLKAPSGRQRLNVLGALNAVTHELMTVINDAYINSQSVCDLLLKIARLNLKTPVTLVLDNARYQRAKLVQALAAQLNIELLFLPPYSPNLNLIERLWKFVKKQCLYSRYYGEFKSFSNAIIDCLKKTHSTYKQQLDSLLTLEFQTFAKSQFVSL
ncbi:IS630 family transposase [archaeon]|nr:IS630 family transposase [archaeon]